MRVLMGRRLVAFLGLAVVVATAPVPVRAQAADPSGEPGGGPSPDPGGLDIQYPRPRLFAMVTIGNGHEYRDRLLSDRSIASVSGGVAWMGFSASAVQNWELTTGRTSRELLVGYSYKLPYVDAHAALVECTNELMLRGCPDGVRLTLTSNSIAGATIEASFDQALSSKRRGISGSVTYDLWANEETSGAVRAGWTRTDYGGGVHLDGTSIRLIASRRITERLAIDMAAGGAWTSGQAQLPETRDGFFATTSLVWRY